LKPPDRTLIEEVALLEGIWQRLQDPGKTMKMNTNQSLCPLCGGHKEPGKTTYSVELGTGVVVVRNVRAEICAQCGEALIDNKTAQKLEKIVEDARQKQHQVEILAL
jgi:YgiT-type zinc finger domain-containing protein